MVAETTVDSETRAAVDDCKSTFPETPTGGDVVFGFDGYLDTVRELSEERSTGTERITSLEVVGNRILEAADADSSLSFGWQTTGKRAGGHVCHLSRAYEKLGYEPTLVGTLGDPIRPFIEERFGHLELHSLGETGTTDAVEFNDGKLMFSEAGEIDSLDWEHLMNTVGRETLADAIDGTRLLGIGYWAMIPGLPSILDGLRERVWPTLSDPPEHVIVDPADVRRLSPDDLEAIVSASGRFATVADLTVSANRVETKAITEAVCGQADADQVENTRRVFDTLDVDRVVSHGVEQSCCVSAAGTSTVAVEPLSEPALTTSAGDHFTAGFSLGLSEGVSESAALVVGNAYARRFVETGQTPDFEELYDAIESYLEQF